MIAAATLSGLFVAAFVAATLLPAQSEAVLVAALLEGTWSPAVLVGVATFGNVLGSLVNWGLGRGIERFGGRRWFPVSPAALERAGTWYRRWGKWSLLGSWLPIVGDPLTVVAGVLREPLPVFLLLVTLGKGGRYLALTAATLGWG